MAAADVIERFPGRADTNDAVAQGEQIPTDQEQIVGIVIDNENKERFSSVLRHCYTIGKSLPKLAMSSTWRTLPRAFARQTVLPELLALSRSMSSMPRAELSR